MSSYHPDPELEVASGFMNHWVLWLIVVMFVASGVAWFFNRGVQTVDTGLVRYQEFQEIYNTTAKLNTDLCNLKKVNEKDQMFKDFSKAQQTLAIQNNLNRWIAEYNAKSSLINFNAWKSATLPYSLNQQQFDCAN